MNAFRAGGKADEQTACQRHGRGLGISSIAHNVYYVKFYSQPPKRWQAVVIPVNRVTDPIGHAAPRNSQVECRRVS